MRHVRLESGLIHTPVDIDFRVENQKNMFEPQFRSGERKYSLQVVLSYLN